MIESINSYYNAPSPCLDLCAPLQKYQAFFVSQNEEATGFSKVALTIAWIVTAFFAYPIFGLLAAVGVAIKAATSQPLEMDPMDMTDLELEEWKGKATVEEWNQAQINRLKLCFALPLPDSAFHVGTSGSHVFQDNLEVYGSWVVADSPKAALDMLRDDAIASMQKHINAGKRIELTRLYERGGVLDPECKGRISVFGYVEEAEGLSIGSQPLEMDPTNMTDLELEAWKGKATVEEWNQAQINRLKSCFELPLPDSAFHVGKRGRVLQRNPGCVYAMSVVADLPKADLYELIDAAITSMQPYINAGRRIELTWVYERGGDLDPECEGAISVLGFVDGAENLFF